MTITVSSFNVGVDHTSSCEKREDSAVINILVHLEKNRYALNLTSTKITLKIQIEFFEKQTPKASQYETWFFEVFYFHYQFLLL